MAGKINISDTWKDINTMKINIGDSWKSVNKAYINIGDTWKQWYTLDPYTYDGMYMLIVSNQGNAFRSTDFGVNWTNVRNTTNKMYGDPFMNENGLIMSISNGEINLSTNSGTSWTEISVYNSGYQGCMSSNGSIQICGGWDRAYVSKTTGSTWEVKNWYNLGFYGPYYGSCCSWDGSIHFICGEKGITKSVDSGTTFNALFSGVYAFRQIACSQTGQYVTCCRVNTKLYVSSDYGVNWELKSDSKSWYSVAISATGQYQMAGVDTGGFYSSNDYGQTWTQKTTVGSGYGVDMSASGKYQIYTSYGNFPQLSSDFGVTFSNTHSTGNYFGCAINKQKI